MSQKATPINQIQQQDMNQPPLDNVEEVLNEMSQHEQGGFYQEGMQGQQQQMMPPQQQQMMMPQQQQMMMPPPMMMPPMKPVQSLTDRLMSELKEALIVAIVFIVLNFEPVSNGLNGVLSRVSGNVTVLLLLKGLMAGVLFYGVKRLVINN
jgi:hypothetical protein